MSKLEHKINSVGDSNASPSTKLIYENQLSLFYRYSNVVNNLEDLIKYPSDILQNELEGYCDFLNFCVAQDELSPNSVAQKFAGIKNALENNYRENDIKWKPIKNKFPQKQRLSGYKPYPNEFLQKMPYKAKTSRNTAVILFQNSIGGRDKISLQKFFMKY